MRKLLLPIAAAGVALVGVALVRPALMFHGPAVSPEILRAIPAALPPTVPTTPVAPPPTPAACGTELALPVPTGKSWNVGPGGDLQAALDGAHLGDEIVLSAGATFAGSFHLPNKSGTGSITVRSSAVDQLPAGVRVGPASATKLARIVGANMADSPITTDAGAHHWHLVGLEIGATPGQYCYAVVAFGTNYETSVTQLPHDLFIDRCWIHGDAGKGVMAGVVLATGAVSITNSSITDVKGSDQETQAILAYNGTGPFSILNNRLEAAGENIMFGGGDPTIQNLVPSDIEIRYNDFDKPLSWKVGDPSYAGTHWVVKNLLELKNARRVTIDGNSFQHSWADGQAGDAVVLTPRNQDGSAPWSTVESVAFTNNLVRHVGGGLSMMGHDDNQTAQAAHDFTFDNNLFYDVGGATWGGNGWFILIDSGNAEPGPLNVHLDHNTAVQSGDPVVSGSPGQFVTHPGLVFTNNLTLNGSGGIWGDLRAQGDPTLATYYPDALVIGNVLIGGPAASYKQHPANQFPASAQWTDAANGDYRLAAGSPLKGSAADGEDPGVDMSALELAATCRK